MKTFLNLYPREKAEVYNDDLSIYVDFDNGTCISFNGEDIGDIYFTKNGEPINGYDYAFGFGTCSKKEFEKICKEHCGLSDEQTKLALDWKGRATDEDLIEKIKKDKRKFIQTGHFSLSDSIFGILMF